MLEFSTVLPALSLYLNNQPLSKILLISLSARIPLLTATSAFRLGRRH